MPQQMIGFFVSIASRISTLNGTERAKKRTSARSRSMFRSNFERAKSYGSSAIT